MTPKTVRHCDVCAVFGFQNYPVQKSPDRYSLYRFYMKVSDTVDHRMFLHKLAQVGLSDALCDLFRNYLVQSRPYVVFKGERSHTYNCSLGVPQRGGGSGTTFLPHIREWYTGKASSLAMPLLPGWFQNVLKYNYTERCPASPNRSTGFGRV